MRKNKLNMFLIKTQSIMCMIIALILFGNGVVQAAPQDNYEQTQKAARLGFFVRTNMRRADKHFIRGEQDKAMEMYKEEFEKAKDGSKAKLRLAYMAARLSMMSQNHEDVVLYYGYLYDIDPELLAIEDVVNYVEAYRALDNDYEAEKRCRVYELNPVYSNESRYVNLLQSLGENRYYFKAGEDTHIVKYMPFNTENAEFYVAKQADSLFYISSRSYMKDANKVFYHQNDYLKFTEGRTRRRVFFKNIPGELQKGAIAYNSDSTIIITTVNVYNGVAAISLKESGTLYSTKLFYSIYDSKRNRWSSFEPIYEDAEENMYSYAHPTFTNNGSTMIFSSNIAGGYGGMDLYITHKQDDGTWSVPVNLGPTVNTSANEIFPTVNNVILTFASSGHVGMGGYDLYSTILYDGEPVVGSLGHYPYPVNTSSNDFMLYADNDITYVASDRAGNDDIYQILDRYTPLTAVERSQVLVGDENAYLGNMAAIDGLLTDHTASNSAYINGGNAEDYEGYFGKDELNWRNPSAPAPAPQIINGKRLLSVYFSFDQSTLTSDMKKQIERALSKVKLSSTARIHVIGYADELGTVAYNTSLSKKRALSVGDFIESQEDKAVVYSEGKGVFFIQLPQEDEPESTSLGSTFSEMPKVDAPKKQTSSRQRSKENLIYLFREARRVDIVIQE